MTRGPGRLLSLCFGIASLLVAFTLVKHYRLAGRMLAVNGEMAPDPAGNGSGIAYEYSRVGVSKGYSYNIKVRYVYVVDSHSYQGRYIGLRGNSFSSKEEAERIVREFKDATTVRVWYDPDHLSFAVLKKPEVGSGLWEILLTLVLLSFLSYTYLDRIYLALRSQGKI